MMKKEYIFLVMTMLIWSCFASVNAALNPDRVEGVQVDSLDLRLINLAPSPYSNRHDAERAGFGIFLSLQNVVTEYNLPVKVSYYDGSENYADGTWITNVLTDANMVLLGAETWCQGPAYYSRRFFENAGGLNLGGTYASAWASSGGYHTGGEVTISTNLRSFMGLGANVFTMGQKLMDFTTEERLTPPAGEYSLFDCWYMDQFARYCCAVGLAGNDQKAFQSYCDQFGCSPFYYSDNFPPDQATLDQFVPLAARLNQAADQDSESYQQLISMYSTVAD